MEKKKTDQDMRVNSVMIYFYIFYRRRIKDVRGLAVKIHASLNNFKD